MSTTAAFWLLLPLLLLLLLLAGSCAAEEPNIYPSPKTETPQMWIKSSRQDMLAAERLYNNVKRHRAKSAILFIGDGMGMTTVTSGRILKGQLARSSGEEAELSFERFPHTALSKTYNTDMQTPDSAGTGTAFMCGVKARFGTVGVNQLVDFANCSSYSDDKKVVSFLEEAAAEGKSVGIVTTTRITHATPAAGYAHSVSRDWEDDTRRNKEVSQDKRSRCVDIAQQLVDKSNKFSVFFGGGRRKFLPKNVTTKDGVSRKMVNGSRSDGVNLVNRWKQTQGSRKSCYIETREQLTQMKAENCDTVLGLFATSHLRYHIDNMMDSGYKEPTLQEMTQKAIEILSKNPKGFALLVEGGRIDHGHHNNSAKRALHDLIAFDEAVDSAMQMTDSDETLVVVSADHSHVFSIGGWANRGNAIFGKVRYSYKNRFNAKGEGLARDGLPYTPLYYGDGPAASIKAARRNITNVDTRDVNYRQDALVNFASESHGSEDVPIYASGPGAHLFHTTHQQSYIANVIKHSLCVGDFQQRGECLAPKAAAAAKAAAALTWMLAAAAAMLQRFFA